MTDLDLAAIRARADAAAPWLSTAVAAGENAWYLDDEEFGGSHGTITPHYVEVYTEANAQFIAHARTDIPALLDLVSQLSKRILDLRNATGRADACYCESYDPCFGECCGVGNCSCSIVEVEL